ncbi:type 4a pilus biogenesis protein PilO [Clostridium sp.]|uniref:type 4a pilus biogenesis protein PilO n=1 Tax=Clostridium sp. TaxID=1506 RepID=UPI002909C0F2|nr:type 4a pilus biogenesis protein PilO [Clostridium sp.]MDU5107371.1 type 4a pilus biogenesis protein PilO [Clostridium sp.]
MNMKKREKYLLGILGAVIISFGYYKLIYIKQSEKLKVKIEERDVLKERYDLTLNSINTLDDKRKEVEALENLVIEKSSELYPEIMQEKLILELDSILKNSKLEGNIIFSEIEVKAIEKLSSLENEVVNSSIKDIVDEYNNNEVSEEASKENVNTSTEATVEELKVAIKFNGSYKEIKAFIEEMEKSERIIAITNITITATSESTLSGTMNLEYHGVPKIKDADSEYLKWKLKNIYGKEDLFSSGSASGAYSVIEEKEEAKADFSIVLKASDSELNSFSMKSTADETGSSISSDNKNDEVEIVLEEVDGKLHYKYKNLDSSYPKDYSLKEFKPNSEKITIHILSEKRTVEADIHKINFKVINKTTKKIEVILENDDDKNPRIDIITEGNGVNIIKK